MVFTSWKIALACETPVFFAYEPLFFAKWFFIRYDKLLRNSLCKVFNVKMDDNQFLQAVLPAAKGGLGVSSARLLVLLVFLASAVGEKRPWAKSLVWSMWMVRMMMRSNGGLNLKKLEWLRKTKSKKNGQSQFWQRNCRHDCTNRTNGPKKIQRVPR